MQGVFPNFLLGCLKFSKKLCNKIPFSCGKRVRETGGARGKEENRRAPLTQAEKVIEYPDVRGCDREEYPHFPAQEEPDGARLWRWWRKAPVSRGEAMPRRFPAVIGFECGPRSFFSARIQVVPRRTSALSFPLRAFFCPQRPPHFPVNYKRRSLTGYEKQRKDHGKSRGPV